MIKIFVFVLIMYIARYPVNKNEPSTINQNGIKVVKTIQAPVCTDEQELVYSSEIRELCANNYEVQMPTTSGFKCYMSYKSITKKSSPQYRLQSISYTGEYGIRMYEDRYLIAIGTNAKASVGTKIDLVLNNGTVIPCIVGDIKADCHTDETNLISKNGCCSEFIVDTQKLDDKARESGDISSCKNAWDSSVNKIIVYKINVLEGEK